VTILDLPSEVLTRIFSQLNLKDLKALTETCKPFNETIGSSASLMKSFKVKWKKDSHQNQHINLLIGSRRHYQKLEIHAVEGINIYLSTFIQNHSSSLDYIRIIDGSLRLIELIGILQATANNLKLLHVYPSKLQNDVAKVTPIHFPKLVALVIYSLSDLQSWIFLYKLFQLARNIKVSLLSNNF
jgi:hypothetical protein